MNGGFAAKWCARELAAAIGNYLVHVRVELRAASRHPNMERKHILMASCEDLITGLNNQLVPLVVEPPAGMIGIGRGFLQNGVRANHFARHEILADAEVLKRALGLDSPQLVSRNIDYAEAVGFLANAHIADCIHRFLLLKAYSFLATFNVLDRV